MNVCVPSDSAENQSTRCARNSKTYFLPWQSRHLPVSYGFPTFSLSVYLKEMFLVADGGNDCIRVFDQSGTFLYKFGKQGNQDGQFDLPHGMLLDSSNNLLVYDCGNNRVQQFSLDGRFTGKTITDLSGPDGIAAASDGRILVTCGTVKKVCILV